MRSLCQRIAVVSLVTCCLGCGKTEPKAGETSTAAPGARSVAEFGHLSAGEARSFLARHPEALVLDVRNPDEWSNELGHIEGARQIPLPELQTRMDELAAWKGKPIIVVCARGARSRSAAGLLAGAGYRQVMNLKGGMVAWRQAEAFP